MLFKHLKVIELASVLAGPSVGQFFAELGAEVIKIENPKTRGDVTRSWKLSTETEESDTSAYFTAVNWGKKSVCLDITIPSQLGQLYELIKTTDIVIASYKPGDAEILKVDYITLSAINPKLIYGHITGYGSHSTRLGYDAIIQAESGFMHLNGEKDGNPVKMPVALIDVLAGHQLKEAILLAIINKMSTGKGAYLEVSLFDTAVASLANQASNYLVAGINPKRTGSEHPNIVPYGTVFKTKDAFEIVLAVGNEKQFSNLCKVLECAHLSQDEKFKTNASRVINRAALNTFLARQIKTFNQSGLLSQLEQHQVPAGAMNSMKEVFELPQTKPLLFHANGIRGLKTFIAKGIETETSLTPPPHLDADTNKVVGLYSNQKNTKSNR